MVPFPFSADSNGLFLILSAGTAAGQQLRATVTGTVADPQGAVVPGVTVTALNTETNVSTEGVSNEQGVYTLQQLTPGPYRITAALSGFKTFVREGITLRTAETVTVKVGLSTGGIEETCTAARGSTPTRSRTSATTSRTRNTNTSTARA